MGGQLPIQALGHGVDSGTRVVSGIVNPWAMGVGVEVSDYTAAQHCRVRVMAWATSALIHSSLVYHGPIAQQLAVSGAYTRIIGYSHRVCIHGRVSRSRCGVFTRQWLRVAARSQHHHRAPTPHIS
jgi:hypothetical protein